MINAFSVDLEEWHQAELIRRHDRGATRISQVEEATAPILDTLAASSVRATFFVVGEVMEAHPDLVRRIRDAGHEIGCHGMTHRPLWTMSEEEFRRDLARFSEVWDRILGGDQPLGYRAPTFSLGADTRWALDVLRERGYRYDASLFPLRTPLYGVRGAPLAPYKPSTADLRVEEPNGGIWEFPMSACEVLGIRVPASGGAYLRLLPYGVSARLLRRINRERPFVAYVHPWEVYCGTPRVHGLSPLDWLATYGGSRTGLGKLKALLRDFSFVPVGEALSEWVANP